jgi:secretion/DNA translocation related TadE-like protein
MPGSVASAGVIAGTLAVCVALGAVAAASVHSQRVAAAADAAALAAADAASGAVPGLPCERAAEVAAAVGATVASCTLDGLIATVSVTAPFGALPVSATARAGPPPENAKPTA